MDTTTLGAVGGEISVLRTVLSLVMVLGAMVLGLWWVRKKGAAYGCLQRRMRVIERLPLDARRSLMLVQVDGRELMLGVTHEQISTLKVLEQGEESVDA